MKTILRSLNDKLFKAELFVGVTLLISIVFLVFLQVFNRFILKQPLSWSEELARYLFIISVFVGISVATKTKAHFGVEFLFEKFNPAMKRVAMTISSIGIIIFLGVIFVNSFSIIESTMAQKSPALGITIGYLYYTLPIVSAVSIIHVLTNLVEDLTGGDKA